MDLRINSTPNPLTSTQLARRVTAPQPGTQEVGFSSAFKNALQSVSSAQDRASALQRAQVFVEYEPQTRIEGDLQQLPPDFAVTELWEVLAGQHGGRASDAAVTVFDSVGFALEDFSALRFLRDAAAELVMGQPIELIPELSDPKDLFGLLHTRTPLLRAAA